MQYSVRYIVSFAAAVCVVCALFVSFSAVSLKSRQDTNKLIDRQRNVLSVAGLMDEGASLDGAQVEQIFTDSIRARVINVHTGEVVPDVSAANFDQRRASKDPATSTVAPPNAAKVRRVPNDAVVYEVMEKGEIKTLILPIEGMGLWSTLYGYIALDADANTIRGITYYEQGETAGLGGEVENPRWKALWPGRTAFNSRWQPVIRVAKGSVGPPDVAPHAVDGLAGATLTSNGVTNMLRFWLGENGFGPYLARYRAQKGI